MMNKVITSIKLNIVSDKINILASSKAAVHAFLKVTH